MSLRLQCGIARNIFNTQFLPVRIQHAEDIPLIMVDIDNGATHFELMASLEAKEVYLALNRLQYKYNTKIKQVYSDGGTQLTCSLLGKKINLYQKKLKSLWGIYNNLPYCQFRNVCE